MELATFANELPDNTLKRSCRPGKAANSGNPWTSVAQGVHRSRGSVVSTICDHILATWENPVAVQLFVRNIKHMRATVATLEKGARRNGVWGK